jgi:hypothetical protein
LWSLVSSEVRILRTQAQCHGLDVACTNPVSIVNTHYTKQSLPAGRRSLEATKAKLLNGKAIILAPYFAVIEKQMPRFKSVTNAATGV